MNVRPSVLVGLLAGVSVLTQLTPPVHSAVTMSNRNREGDNNQSRYSVRGGSRVNTPSPSRTDSRPVFGTPNANRGNTVFGSPRAYPQGGGNVTAAPNYTFSGGGNPGAVPNYTYSGRGATLGTPSGSFSRGDRARGTYRSNPNVLGTPNVVRPQGQGQGTPQTRPLLGTPNGSGSGANPNVRYNGNRGGNRNRPGTVFSQPGNRNDDGVTQAGRILGTTRAVDRYGRTEAGRSLGSPVYNYPSASPRIDVIGGRGSNPIYWYNPLNGQYEKRNVRDHSRRRVNVLLGTASRKPVHRLNWGGATHYVFYPYYSYNSLDYGYPLYPSPYFYYGYGPGYIPSTRVIYIDRYTDRYVERPVYAGEDNEYAGDAGDYYLNRGADVDQDVEVAMSDIRKAWLLGDIDLLLRHLRSEGEIGVFLKGKYTYSLPPDDYRDMTQDAMKNTTTTDFRWVGVDRRADDETVVKAEHTFTDADGKKRTVFVSFTLVSIHGAWWVAEVGSSDKKATL